MFIENTIHKDQLERSAGDWEGGSEAAVSSLSFSKYMAPVWQRLPVSPPSKRGTGTATVPPWAPLYPFVLTQLLVC